MRALPYSLTTALSVACSNSDDKGEGDPSPVTGNSSTTARALPPESFDLELGLHRIVLRSNVLQDPVGLLLDGEFLLRELPTGDGRGGGSETLFVVESI